MSGLGNLTLAGASAYSGNIIVVSSGTLILNGTVSGSPFVVNSLGAFLAGTGTNNASADISGTAASCPGARSPTGTLTARSVR